MAPGQSSIAICPLCRIRRNVNNYASGNQVGLGTSANDVVCEHAVKYSPFGTPFCVTFEGTGESCGTDPEPICTPSSGNDGIENCFQFQWGWEECDPTVDDCPCTAFVRSIEDDSTSCSSCERCPDNTLSWDCGNVEQSFRRRAYRDCYRNEEVCAPGTEGYLKCAEFHGGCAHEGCQCTYAVLDAELNELPCRSCGFCADGSISYDCTSVGQGFHSCGNPSTAHADVVSQSHSKSYETLQETLCLPDSDGDGILNCFHFEGDWEECDPSEEQCPCEAFVRSTEDGDSTACHSCERCSDDTLAWDCYNLNYPRHFASFRRCDGSEGHCEVGRDGSLLCATYTSGCTDDAENCPCQFDVRDSDVDSFSCGVCSFCPDGSIAYDCSGHGKGSHSCGGGDTICYQDCLDGAFFVNPDCYNNCIVCEYPEVSDDEVFRFGGSDVWEVVLGESDPSSETPSAAPAALLTTMAILPYPLPRLIHTVFY